MQTQSKEEMPGKALKKREHSENHYSKRSPHFTGKICVFSFVLSMVILTGMGWYAWSSFKQLANFDSQKGEMAELRGTILHFDEVLTMSARMAAATGDVKWENRYRTFEPQLDDAIKKAKKLAPKDFMSRTAGQTDAANIKLVAIENESFDLTRQGNLQAATKLLYSQEYEKQKSLYKEGMEQYVTTLQNHIENENNKIRSTVLIFFAFLVFMFSLIVFSCITILQMRKHLFERKKAEDEKEQLQSQLRQAQKMEALGTLAGGIAHDFNNILGALMGFADLAKGDIPEGTLAHQNQEEVLNAANRAKELVKQILTFGRKDEAKLIPVQMNSIVTEALKMLRSSLPTTIEIDQDVNCNNAIMADETYIHQVLLNLGTNAAHAMSENGGVLEVNLIDVNIKSDIMTNDGLLKRGSYVKITVRDSGCGMSEEIVERIFEPFYTTKEVGKGTGMGLSVVHGIVENHNGVITVDSKPGEGTTFEIFFPCVGSRENIETEVPKVAFGQGERILIVDDESLL